MKPFFSSIYVDSIKKKNVININVKLMLNLVTNFSIFRHQTLSLLFCFVLEMIFIHF